MNWYILTAVSIIVVIGSFYLLYFGSDKWFYGLLTIFLIFIVVLPISLGLSLRSKLPIPKEISSFEKQKEYIQNHKTGSEIEDAALTAKKIELNEWLYEAQYSVEKYGRWSVYPESVLDLEPIE